MSRQINLLTWFRTCLFPRKTISAHLPLHVPAHVPKGTRNAFLHHVSLQHPKHKETIANNQHPPVLYAPIQVRLKAAVLLSSFQTAQLMRWPFWKHHKMAVFYTSILQGQKRGDLQVQYAQYYHQKPQIRPEVWFLERTLFSEIHPEWATKD